MLAKPALPFVGAELLTSLCSDMEHAQYTLQHMHNMQNILCTSNYVKPRCRLNYIMLYAKLLLSEHGCNTVSIM